MEPHTEQWAIDEVTLVSLLCGGRLGMCLAAPFGRSPLRTIARHQATLQRLHTTEIEVASKDQLIRTVSHELRTPRPRSLDMPNCSGETQDRSPRA